MNLRSLLRFPVWLVVVVVLSTRPAIGAAPVRAGPAAQDPAPPAEPTATITADDVRAWLTAVKDATSLPEPVRTQLDASYQKALADLMRADESRRRAESFRQKTVSAPADTEAAQKELETLGEQPALEAGVAPDAPVAEIEQALARAGSELGQLQSEVTTIEAEDRTRTDRRNQVPGLREAEASRLADANAVLTGPAPAVDALSIAFAGWVEAGAKRIAAAAEIESLDAELPSYDARGRQLRARIDLAQRKVQRATERAALLRAMQQQARAREAEREKETAERVAREGAIVHPVLQEVANENVEIVRLRSDPAGLLARIDAASRQQVEMAETLKAAEEKFAQAKRYIDTVGLSDLLSRVLRPPSETKSAMREHVRAIEAREVKLAELGLLRIELEEERRAVRDPVKRARERFDEIAIETDESGIAELRAQQIDKRLQELYQARLAAIDSALDDVELLTRLLLDLNQNERQLVELTTKYQEFVDARVVWLRNADGLGIDALRDAYARARKLMVEEQPLETGKALFADFKRYYAVYAGFALFLFVVSRYRRKLRSVFRGADLERVGFFNASKPIVAGVLEAMLGALPLPLIFEFIAQRCIAVSQANDPARAIATSLRFTEVFLFALMLLIKLMRRDGLFERHLGWPPRAVSAMRRRTGILALVVVPLACVYGYFVARPTLQPSEPFARLCFVAALVATGTYGFAVLRPVTVALQQTLKDATGKIFRRRMLHLVLACYGPLLTAALSVWGYQTTAQRIVEKLLPTALAISGLVIAVQLFDSWFYIARRAEALARLQKRREELRAEQVQKKRGETKDGAAQSPEAPTVEVPAEVNEVDLRKVNAQARELVRGFGAVVLLITLWFIWRDTVPALRVLDTVTLWTVKSSGAGDGVRAITLIDFGSAMVAVLLTYMVARNFPGLLEAAILSRLPLDAGARYAALTVLRYLITLAGVVVIFERLGVGWEDFQWLVAAISVGLGFGLQEIFGNFVSGIIVLIERPLRVGDTVTVAGVSGTVTKIRIRTTTIVDGDNKEHIIPNKAMITGEVVNWVLSSPVIRVGIQVRVAYGTDTRKVEQLLLSIAKSHSDVVDDPAPSVVFSGFGESSLDFQLSAFSRSPALAGKVKTDLYRAIDEAFRRQGIEIPFPTRELIRRDADRPE